MGAAKKNMEELKEKIKLLVKEAGDGELEIYMDRAKADILGFCNVDRLPAGCESALIELVVYYCNKQGIEGVTGYSEGGTGYTFEVGMPQNIRQRLAPFCKGRVLEL